MTAVPPSRSLSACSTSMCHKQEQLLGHNRFPLRSLFPFVDPHFRAYLHLIQYLWELAGDLHGILNTFLPQKELAITAQYTSGTR